MNLVEKLHRQLQAQIENQRKLGSKEVSIRDDVLAEAESSSFEGPDSIARQLEQQRRRQLRPRGQFDFSESQIDSGPELGGEFKKTAAGPFLYFSKNYDFEFGSVERDRSERTRLVCSLASLLLGRNTDCSPGQIAFLDTETTGLSGGAGTYAFLVGVGSWNSGGFCVEQYFMRDFDEEPAVLLALQERLSSIQVLVSFNGKSFDVPLLESRYLIGRLVWPLAQASHLDLLHPARRLWKLRLGDCSLVNLEQQILGWERKGDVAGHLIPHLYFNYTRTGTPYGLKPIIEHNRQDIKTLAHLTLRLGEIVLGLGSINDLVPEDLFSVGKYCQHLGQQELSLEFNQAALQTELPFHLRVDAMHRLAGLLKCQKNYPQAVELWKAILSTSSGFHEEACENLAIHYEHREKDMAAALAWTNFAISRIENYENRGSRRRETLAFCQHRRGRLRRKLAKQVFAVNSSQRPCTLIPLKIDS